MRTSTFVTTATVTLSLLVPGWSTVAAQPAEPGTWHVRAGAGAGDGSAERPFDSLGTVERVSGPGDIIIIDPAPADLPPLDGGIVLKPGQQLIGGGAPVTALPPGAPSPRLTNTTNIAGDVVRLAPGTAVRNLVLDGATRAGIYGLDATDVVVEGNDISGTNRLCHDGFMIGPFQIPAAIAVRKTLPKLPDFVILNNGFAAVMLDYPGSSGSARITANRVHDTGCGDGIDVRTFGSSVVTAELSDNTVSNINIGLAKLSVLAMGLQSKDDSSLTATLTGNTQTGIALAGNQPTNLFADSEGVFINPVDRSHMSVRIDRNTFRHGSGNFSANGLEYVTTSGSPTSEVIVTDSSFDDVTGDVIESYNLSPDAAAHALTLDGVRASRSHFPAAMLNPIVPANLGSCLVTTGFGRDSATELTVRNSDLRDCSADGLAVVTYVPDGPQPARARMSFDIRDTTIAGAAANGLNILNVGNLATLHGRMENSTITGAAGAAIRASSDGTIAEPVVDFGGGALGSTGGNCVASSDGVDITGIPVSAGNNWWGTQSGTFTRAGMDTGAQLTAPPRPNC
ncbi:hypothetical protein H0264_23345 [Nocardia huaxiensis]|uniref:Parallel beta helix pectate lyase-like protein n=1 Tax=Nocardia huaxiensis TaxID=2755382 RepID=A0A7D6V7M1_9NOCA|nr:hypothetical protein [Nocardia huaxiensis]QLY28311.1 hypothetical protein H0264_23345 [Nocardia huaxiensis]